LAAYYPKRINKLILVDSAGIRPKRGLGYRFRVGKFKILKRVFSLLGDWGEEKIQSLYCKAGSVDYRNAGVLRPVLVRAVNEDLTPILDKITCRTMLIWGEHDVDTPLGDGQLMHRRISSSQLVVIKNAGHYSYLNNPEYFCDIVIDFLHSSCLN
jgi:pimeloyl-ACP methyl ester carboxylesterase